MFHLVIQRFKQWVSWRMGVAIALLSISGLVLVYLHQVELNVLTPAGLKAVVGQAGIWGPLVYVSALMLSVVLSYIPGLPLVMAAGMVWGPLWAAIYSVIGGFLGGLLAYCLGYFLGRPLMKALTGRVLYFSTHRGETYIGWILFVGRLLPIMSFDLMSYGAGVTGIALPIYCTATLLGMIPSTLLITYVGATGITHGMASAGVTALCLGGCLGLMWGVQTRNWFNLKDVIRVE